MKMLEQVTMEHFKEFLNFPSETISLKDFQQQILKTDLYYEFDEQNLSQIFDVILR